MNSNVINEITSDVALYIHTYNHLPSNFITKKEAKKLVEKKLAGSSWDGCFQ